MSRKEPYIVDVEPRQYAFCSCGRSGKLPYCDGSHSGTGLGPRIEDFQEACRIAICGCGLSKKLPFCDGSHKQL